MVAQRGNLGVQVRILLSPQTIEYDDTGENRTKTQANEPYLL